MADDTAPPIVAARVTMHEAKRHFGAGGAVLVSEYGHGPTRTVRPDTTTHDRARTTWDALAADVKEWRNRYPNQRFYIVPRPGVVAVDDARPADPDGTHFIGCGCDETERDDIDVDTLDEMTMAAAMVARVPAILEGDEGWLADTLDAIGNALIGSGYARTNDAGMFATTGRAERAAAPIR